MPKVVFDGELSLVLQWDLDHHEATLHIDGESLAYKLVEKLLPEYDEHTSYGESLGRFKVTFESSAAE